MKLRGFWPGWRKCLTRARIISQAFLVTCCRRGGSTRGRLGHGWTSGRVLLYLNQRRRVQASRISATDAAGMAYLERISLRVPSDRTPHQVGKVRSKSRDKK